MSDMAPIPSLTTVLTNRPQADEATASAARGIWPLITMPAVEDAQFQSDQPAPATALSGCLPGFIRQRLRSTGPLAAPKSP